MNDRYMNNKAYLFLADGFEDIEALGTRDVLKRAGLDVIGVSINQERQVRSAHGLNVLADTTLDAIAEIDGGDIMIFPGGMPGAANLAGCPRLVSLLRSHFDADGLVAAICAAPGLVLGLLPVKGIRMTCYDGFEDRLRAAGAVFVARPAVRSGNVITGRDPGHTLDFALEIVKAAVGEYAAEKVRAGMTLTCE